MTSWCLAFKLHYNNASPVPAFWFLHVKPTQNCTSERRKTKSGTKFIFYITFSRVWSVPNRKGWQLLSGCLINFQIMSQLFPASLSYPAIRKRLNSRHILVVISENSVTATNAAIQCSTLELRQFTWTKAAPNSKLLFQTQNSGRHKDLMISIPRPWDSSPDRNLAPQNDAPSFNKHFIASFGLSFIC